MIEEPGADIQAEPEGQAGPPECYPSAGAQHPKETECSGQDSGGSIFSVTSYRKTQMKFLANLIISFVSTNLKQLYLKLMTFKGLNTKSDFQYFFSPLFSFVVFTLRK